MAKSNRVPFRSTRAMSIQRVLPLLREGNGWIDRDADMDRLLILADRIVCGTEQHAEFGVLSESIPELLAGAEQAVASGHVTTFFVAQFLGELESWYKWILFNIDHKLYEKRLKEDRNVKDKKFTLHSVISDLQLLPDEDLRRGQGDRGLIRDPVCRCVHWAKSARNQAAHRATLDDPSVTMIKLADILVAVLAPVAKHRSQLEAIFGGLIANAIPQESTSILLVGGVANERAHHLRGFAGRNAETARLMQYVADPAYDGQYLLLTGPQGIGKSALLASLSLDLSRSCAPIGPEVVSVTDMAPWLPACILFHGKQSSRLEEIVECIFDQANVLMVTPQPRDIFHELGKREAISPPIDGMLKEMALPADMIAVLRKRMSHIVAQLVQDRGSAVIIIDALDEIMNDARQLEFLPPTLPRGARIVLSCRERADLHDWLQTRRSCTTMRIAGVDRETVPVLTGVSDETDAHKAFNDRVFWESAGWPLMITRTGAAVQAQDGSIESITVLNSAAAVFKQMALQWRREGMAADLDPLLAAVEVLAIMEDSGHVAMIDLVHCLRAMSIAIEPHELDVLLAPVSDQIDRRLDDSIRLAIAPFASHLKSRHFSAEHLRRVALQCLQALAASRDSWARAFALVEAQARHEAAPVHGALTVSAEHIDVMASKSETEYLQFVFKSSSEKLSTSEDTDTAVADSSSAQLALAERCAAALRDLGAHGAAIDLALQLVRGARASDLERAKMLVAAAAGSGNPDAHDVLAQIALLQQDSKEAFAHALEAATIGKDALRMKRFVFHAVTHPDAEVRAACLPLFRAWVDNTDLLSMSEDAELANLLGRYLATDKCVVDPDDWNRGELLLLRVLQSDAADRTRSYAAAFLLETPCDMHVEEQAVDLLRSLDLDAFADARFAVYEITFSTDANIRKAAVARLRSHAREYMFAAYNYAQSVCRRGMEGDPVEAVDIIRQHYVSGSSGAWTLLVSLLVRGPVAVRDHAEALRILEVEAANGTDGARAQLGGYLIDEDFELSDPSRGMAELRAASEAGDVLATTQLGSYLSQKADGPADIEEGRELLDAAALSGDPMCKQIQLIGHIADDPGGIDWDHTCRVLEVSARLGDGAKMLYLAVTEGAPTDPRFDMDMVIRHLRLGCRHGDDESLTLLARELAMGATVDYDPESAWWLSTLAFRNGDTDVLTLWLDWSDYGTIENDELTEFRQTFHEQFTADMNAPGAEASAWGVWGDIYRHSGDGAVKVGALAKLREEAQNHDEARRLLIRLLWQFEAQAPEHHEASAMALGEIGRVVAGENLPERCKQLIEASAVHFLYCSCGGVFPGDHLAVCHDLARTSSGVRGALGFTYLYGVGGRLDVASGVDYLESAANEGHLWPAAILGDYWMNCDPDVIQNARGKDMLEQTARRSRNSVAAALLGDNLARGGEATEERERGMRLLRVASRQGSYIGVQLLIDHLHRSGNDEEVSVLERRRSVLVCDDWIAPFLKARRDVLRA